MIALLSNFQNTKIEILSPELINILLLLFFFLISLLTIKKDRKALNNFMSYDQTEQLKGIAIFFVILGHLWVHVSITKPSVVLSGDAVSMFLILSGYGLSKSSKLKIIKLKIFLSKRINRVMIPYWFATTLILILDFILLGKTIELKSLILTYLGLNFSVELWHLDYVRWFVTFILFWYFIFYICHNYFENKNRVLFLILIASIILPTDYYLLHFGWYKFFSFPIGCMIGIYFEPIEKLWQRHKKTMITIASLALISALFYKIITNDKHIHTVIYDLVPNIFMAYINDGVSMIISFSIFILFISVSSRGYVSKLLLFLGRYSYELFLLHGAFLIKYNPFLNEGTKNYILFTFIIFFIFITGLSFILSKISRIAYAKSKS
jgi:membrane-bound acyltransferase YfiQ involved in biofilm formation